MAKSDNIISGLFIAVYTIILVVCIILFYMTFDLDFSFPVIGFKMQKNTVWMMRTIVVLSTVMLSITIFTHVRDIYEDQNQQAV